MNLDTFERAVRRAGLVAALGTLAIIFVGVWQGMRRTRGREAGHMPGFLHRRSVFAPMSALGFGVLVYLWRPLPLKLPAPVRAAATILGALLYFPGIALFLWGRKTMGEMYDVSSGLGAQLYTGHRLITTGPFGLVRHPLYVAGVMFEIGALLMFRTWATVLIMPNIPSLILRSRREEEALASEFGDEWTEYTKRVPAWIPRL